jgi:hypothetical protein
MGILMCHRLWRGRSLNDWWDETISKIPKDRRREASRAIIYSVWGVWREKKTIAGKFSRVPHFSRGPSWSW